MIKWCNSLGILTQDEPRRGNLLTNFYRKLSIILPWFIKQKKKAYILNLFLISQILILIILSYHKRCKTVGFHTERPPFLPSPSFFQGLLRVPASGRAPSHTIPSFVSWLLHITSLNFHKTITQNLFWPGNAPAVPPTQWQSQDSCQALHFVPRGLWIWLLPYVRMFFRLLRHSPKM